MIAEASDGEEALRLLEEIPADVAILDLSMPRMNGLETIRRVTKKIPRTKILVLSMYGDEQFVSQALRDGAEGIHPQACDGRGAVSCAGCDSRFTGDNI